MQERQSRAQPRRCSRSIIHVKPGFQMFLLKNLMPINVPVLMFMILPGCKHLRLQTRRGRHKKGRTAGVIHQRGAASSGMAITAAGVSSGGTSEANVADNYFTEAAVGKILQPNTIVSPSSPLFPHPKTAPLASGARSIGEPGGLSHVAAMAPVGRLL